MFRSLTVMTLALAMACGGEAEVTPAPEPAAEAEAVPAPPPKPEVPPTPTAFTDAEVNAEALANPASLTATAPEFYWVQFTTTKGPFVVRVHREWAPQGADRLYNLVKAGYFTDIAFFRAIDGFMVQFGIHGDPSMATAWREARITDDPVTETNRRGRITFATAGPNTRTTQLFINYRDNANLDRMGFAPLGEVVEGMDIVDSLHKGYGEGAPRGRGPHQGRLQSEGNPYLKAEFPDLDYIQKAALAE